MERTSSMAAVDMGQGPVVDGEGNDAPVRVVQS